EVFRNLHKTLAIAKNANRLPLPSAADLSHPYELFHAQLAFPAATIPSYLPYWKNSGSMACNSSSSWHELVNPHFQNEIRRFATALRASTGDHERLHVTPPPDLYRCCLAQGVTRYWLT